MDEKSKIIKILIFLWLIIGIIFTIGGLYSISSLVLPSLSQSAVEYDIALSMGFFIWFSLLSIFLFICAFLSFMLSFATIKRKRWARGGGIILSVIFLLIFLIPTGFLIWLSIEWPSVFFRAPMLGIFAIAVFSIVTSISIIILLLRPQIKAYFV